MNSKQRVAAAIARQPVDRVPLGLYAVDHDIIAKVIGRATIVRNQLGMQLALWQGRREEMIEQWKTDLTDFYRKIDCVDVITCRDAMFMSPPGYLISPLMPPPHPDGDRVPRKTAENTWEDSHGRVFKAIPQANEIRCVYDPTTAAGAPEPEFTEDMFPPFDPATAQAPDPSCFAVLDHIIAQFGADRYIAGFNGGVVAVTMLGGFEYGLMLYHLDPAVIDAHNRQAVARANYMDQFFIRPGVAGTIFDQDMAGTNAPYLSPQTFREHCLPYMRQRVEHVKQAGKQLIMHNCGCNLPLMDQFIEASVDCYQSLQTTAGMDIGMLKQRYGGHLAFWGGVPLETLQAGTAAEVRQAVRRTLELAGRGGGIILGPSQSIAAGTKYENFMAMLDEYVKLRDTI